MYQIEAIFENGAFRPVVPIAMADGERVSLKVELKAKPLHDLSDVMDLLDTELMESRARVTSPPTLEEVRAALSAYDGCLSDLIAEERNER